MRIRTSETERAHWERILPAGTRVYHVRLDAHGVVERYIDTVSRGVRVYVRDCEDMGLAVWSPAELREDVG